MSTFHFSSLELGGGSEQIFVIFVSDQAHFEEELISTINDVTNTRLPPSRILIVCRLGCESKIEAAYRAQQHYIEDRLRNTTHICIVPYNHCGSLSLPNVINLHTNANIWKIDDTLLYDAATQGLSKIVENTKNNSSRPSWVPVLETFEQ